MNPVFRSLVSLVAFGALPVLSGTDAVLQQFMAANAGNPDAALYRLELDLDGDGIHEVLMSRSDWRNGKAGLIWRGYRVTATGAVELAGTPSIRPDLCRVGVNPETGRRALITVFPGGAQRVSVMAVELVDNRLVETKCAAIEQVDVAAQIASLRFGPASSNLVPTRIDVKPGVVAVAALPGPGATQSVTAVNLAGRIIGKPPRPAWLVALAVLAAACLLAWRLCSKRGSSR